MPGGQARSCLDDTINRMIPHSLELEISPERLRHVRWIGGGSGAGKSTIAGLLAEEYGLRLYHSDDTQSAHAARSNAADHPMPHAFLTIRNVRRVWVSITILSHLSGIIES